MELDQAVSIIQMVNLSRRFSDKGFATQSPLRVMNNKTNIAKVSSFVLLCISRKSFKHEDYQELKTLLWDLSISKLNFQKISALEKNILKSNPKYNTELLNNLDKLGQNVNKDPRSVLKAEDTVLLFSKVQFYCKTTNKNALAFYSF